MATARSAKKAATNGGAAMKANETITDNTPEGSVAKREPTDLPADYFRDGRVEEITKTVDGKEITEYRYAPVPYALESRDHLRERDNIAHIRLMTGIEGKNQKNLVPPFQKFILTSVQVPQREKFQIVQTFKDWYIFFYGQQPSIYTFSGYLLNLPNYNWLNEFDIYYDQFLRGTKATQFVARTYITFNFQQIQGHVLAFNYSLDAATDKAVPFSMQVAVVKRYALTKDANNRLSDSFFLNADTIEAFKKLVSQGNSKVKPDYTIVKQILNQQKPPASAEPITKKRREAIVKELAAVGLKEYGQNEYA